MIRRIEYGILFLVWILVLVALILMLGGCQSTHPPYVCQQGLHESGQPVLLCYPVNPDQIVERPAPVVPKRMLPDERT